MYSLKCSIHQGKLQNQMGSLKKKNNTNFIPSLPENRREGILSNTFYFTLIPKSVSLMNVDAGKRKKRHRD